MKCLSDANRTVQFTTTLTHSNENGDVIAATLIAQLSVKVMSHTNGLQLGNNAFIKSLNYSNSSIVPVNIERSSSRVGIYVGIFFCGFLITTLCYGILLTIYCIWYVTIYNVTLISLKNESNQ